MAIRVRFAPSPTGYLHVGGARTALFNWLLARKQRGVFILRIEDTDKERSSEAMTRAIVEGLRWLGLDWDEGPHHQADGIERHRADARQLLESGAAYRCFCTPEELAAKRAEAEARKERYGYDRRCLRELTPERSAARAAAGERCAIRFRVPEGVTEWNDLVHGPTRFVNAEIDDFIVLRSDGTPTYNLAVVSDDSWMRVTHVIRGDDHLSNTPKQILLYRTLGRPLPEFAHVPMILGPDGRRLSKRHGATSIADHEARGILPWAMVNFLALLGWSPGTDEEVMDVPELITKFSIDRVLKKSSVFDLKKLEWLNAQHMARADAQLLEPLVAPRLAARGLASAEELQARREWYLALIDLLKGRARDLEELAERVRPYVAGVIRYEEEAVGRHWRDGPQVALRLERLTELLADAPWEAAPLEDRLRAFAAELGIPAGKLIHPLRVALTGQAVSPGIFDVLVAMGRERALGRIRDAVCYLRDRFAAGASAPEP
ncbi:MAG: glutamate--tRNA ligase [Gemmatimonadetes bacterium]|nr:glutamate--tRNA ligase [Gemmatimonadota bacterium]